MSSQKSCFLLVACVGLWCISAAFALRADWKDFIHPDIYKKYVGKRTSNFSKNYFQGDIDKVDPDISEDEMWMAANAIKDEKFRWPNGTVPFIISITYSEEEQKLIRKALTAITELTNDCVRFIRRTDEEDYIQITRGLGCTSSVGRQGGVQKVTFTRGCLDEFGDVQHEILHVLGFYHEHTRKDRDEHVTIYSDNILEVDKIQFQKYDGFTFDLPYDYSSVMHYPWNAFSVDANLPTMTPTEKFAKIGQRTNLSSLDIVRIQRAYGCDPLDRITKNQPEDQSAMKLTLANMKQADLTEEQCRQFAVGSCSMHSSSCPSGAFFSTCAGPSSSDVKTHLEKLKHVIPSSPLEIQMYSPIELSADTFSPMAQNIIKLQLMWYNDFATDRLSEVGLTNLVQLMFLLCQRLHVTKAGLSHFPNLRQLTMLYSTIESMEIGALESLGSLKSLDLNFGYGDDEKSQLRLLYCSADYVWFRRYLHRHPQLLQAKLRGEVYNIAGQVSDSLNSREIIPPVDCARKRTF